VAKDDKTDDAADDTRMMMPARKIDPAASSRALSMRL